MGLFKRKEVFIPIPTHGMYSELWENENYLNEVKNVAKTRVWIVEITEIVKILREYADNAMEPIELQSINKCIGVVKKLLVLDTHAIRTIDEIKVEKELNK